MLDPASGPFLFDTSAEGWFGRSDSPAIRQWFRAYVNVHPVHVSSVTVMERVRGYALLWRRERSSGRRDEIERARLAYLGGTGRVWPVDAGVAVVAAEIMALLPEPPTPPKRTHRLVESRGQRLARWRFDCIIAATALANGILLVHNNARDFEAIRGAVENSPLRFPGLGPLELRRCTSVM